ncbi:MAG: hypothetical protein KZQ99_18530 [Candidatus Thiodiazotropha sp. (ex Dulcina madagascariensis)]|nr:hypothetical protein [Candidatus Thiodiazotropha sp. (ex Dulcina madagascariensis)]
MKANSPSNPQGRNKPAKSLTWSILFILFCLTALSACTKRGYYSFTRDVHGWVVDGTTGAPLEDVIVVGAWPRIGSTLCGDHEAMRSHFYETTTNRSGEFGIPGCLKTTGIFFHSDGGLSFYKRGYFPKKIYNDPLWRPAKGKEKMGIYGPGWVWQFEGAVVELEPSVGMSREQLDKIKRSKNLRLVTDYLGLYGSECMWLKMPRMTMATGHRIKERNKGHDGQDKAKKPLAQYLVEHFFIDPEQCHPDPIGFLMEYKDEME